MKGITTLNINLNEAINRILAETSPTLKVWLSCQWPSLLNQFNRVKETGLTPSTPLSFFSSIIVGNFMIIYMFIIITIMASSNSQIIHNNCLINIITKSWYIIFDSWAQLGLNPTVNSILLKPFTLDIISFNQFPKYHCTRQFGQIRNPKQSHFIFYMSFIS